MYEIDRVRKPDVADFFNGFIVRGRPAVIENSMDEWPIMRRDIASLIQGTKEVYVIEDELGLYGPRHASRTSMRFLDLLALWNSRNNVKTYYVAQQSLEALHPELLDFVRPPAYLPHSSLVAMNLWMGNGRIRWHFDGVDNFICQLHGRKKVRLLEPEKLEQLYVYGRQWSAIDDVDCVDRSIFPAARTVHETHDTTLAKGDMLFLPAAWWHTASAEEGWGASLNCWYGTWYGSPKSEFERPFFSALENLTHLLADEVPTPERLHYCRYAREVLQRIARGHSLPAKSTGGWDNPKRIDFTGVEHRVPPRYRDQ